MHQVLFQEDPLGVHLVDTGSITSWKPIVDGVQARRSKAEFYFDLNSIPREPLAIRLMGHGKFRILINGQTACELTGMVHATAEGESPVPVTAAILPEASLELLKPGSNKIVVEVEPSRTKRSFKLQPKELSGAVLLGSFELLRI
jgi:hypothetical protein